LSPKIARLCSIGILVAAPAAAAQTSVWESFLDSATIGMTSGLDLLVGTDDDVPPDANVEGFNSQGSLAHSFFFDPVLLGVTAGSSFTNRLVDPSGTPLGSGAMLMDFSIEGRSDDLVKVNDIPLGVPFSFTDDPMVLPHEMIVAPDGRSFHFEFRQVSCVDTDPTCSVPLIVIDTVADGVILVRGDDPDELVANAPDAFTGFFDVWTSGTANLEAYFAYLETLAPSDWAAISMTVFSYLVEEGVNLEGQQAPLVDNNVLVGVIPSFTIPEPGAAARAGAVLSILFVFAALRRRA